MNLSYQTEDLFDLFKASMREVEGALPSSTFSQVSEICKQLAQARKIALYGVGREGLVVKAFCMRLMHLGLSVSMVGDMTTPHIGEGDLLVVSAGPGHFSSVAALAGEARKSGAKVLLFTAQPEISKKIDSTSVVYIPAQTMADDQDASRTSVLPMGSLYEIAMLMFCEITIEALKEVLRVEPATMRGNHTNLE
jgi:6-phospho-3-hexuloisomerase